MLEMQRIFNQFRRQIAIVLLVTLVWIISLPATSVHADGYYSNQSHKVEKTKPYYSTKERSLVQNEYHEPYYTSKERHREKAITNQPQTRDEIDSGKRIKEVRPKDLESRNR
ncbi:hypothetical protein I8748_33040 [Nostoc sp. CENA67]|uniref:Uncharacterized protein n=1 Tax=Amazonocrinis nigriterrae CENA67 TaxID=2794033 RepID=A0A8J7LBM8_9NOST|nr:hypothetical protein [Amazonocrinis nigriterrae]MBH8566918.1 hypothetical protein [Amazonocrinis nigriterrae CENA67]